MTLRMQPGSATVEFKGGPLDGVLRTVDALPIHIDLPAHVGGYQCTVRYTRAAAHGAGPLTYRYDGHRFNDNVETSFLREV